MSACIIATSLNHSKCNYRYCNSLLLNLPSTQTKRLQFDLNAALVLSPKLINFITFLLFLNFFTGSKLTRELNTKFSLPCITLHSGHPSCLHCLLSLNREFSTRLSSLSHLIVLNSNNARLKIIIKCFHLTAPTLWNRLPPDLRHF
jgi:hypothetical protein